MSFLEFDSLRAAHLLARVQSEPGMRADVLFERTCKDTISWSSQGPTTDTPQRRSYCEQGFAIRLLTGERTWQESRDVLEGDAFDKALRRVARSLSSVPLPSFTIRTTPWPKLDGSLAAVPRAVELAVRDRRVGFPFSLDLALHRRELVLAGPTILAEPQCEHYLAFKAAFSGHLVGGLIPVPLCTNPKTPQTTPPRGISAEHHAGISATIASVLVERFRARSAAAISSGTCDIVLGPNATAVFLHEAVSHALEVDILSMSGKLSDAIGVQIGSPLLTILDDPASAPAGVRRTHDDEGTPTSKRWLVREGEVRQPIADVAWNEREAVDPGCGRRATRHDLAAPRSYFLNLLAGNTSSADLLAGEGLWFDQVQSGSLQPLTGDVRLHAACGRRFHQGVLGERVGPFTLTGRLADLLSTVSAVGKDSATSGAGWCAKDGQRMPVWARTPALRLENVQLNPR